jgi:nicotinamide-nucleotide adenylyltransferase
MPKSKSRNCLFIGRFQPFHNGHLDALQQILKHEKNVIIMIGSAQYHDASGQKSPIGEENPFNTSQRIQMIEKSLKQAKISKSKYMIIPVWNIENNEKWPTHIDTIVPPYEYVYTGSKRTEDLFKKYSKHPVKKITFRKKITATDIRKRMQEGKKWTHLVPEAVTKILTHIS